MTDQLPINLDTGSVGESNPKLVCRFCKRPIYEAAHGEGYLHLNTGLVECDFPPDSLYRATPYPDNTTYVTFRAELITEMTQCTVSYVEVQHSPGELLELLLADARHYAEAKGLTFDDHARRSYQIFLANHDNREIASKRIAKESRTLRQLRSQNSR